MRRPSPTSPHRRTAPSTAAATAATEPDGRRRRTVQARTQVLDALMSLLGEANYAPSMQEISERAGVSRRLVFHHFQDAETLFSALAQRQLEALADLFGPIPLSLPLPSRLLALVEQRARIYEKISHTRRAALMREPTAPIIARGLQAFRAAKRAQVEAVFAPELDSCHPSVRAEIAAALGAAASFSTWESLRAHQGIGSDAAQRALIHLLGGVLRLTPAGSNLIVLRGASER